MTNHAQGIAKPKLFKSHENIKRARKDYCEVCGDPYMLEIHHIKTKASGGEDYLENLICLCRVCHTKAHNGQISKEQLWECKNADSMSL